MYYTSTGSIHYCVECTVHWLDRHIRHRLALYLWSSHAGRDRCLTLQQPCKAWIHCCYEAHRPSFIVHDHIIYDVLSYYYCITLYYLLHYTIPLIPRRTSNHHAIEENLAFHGYSKFWLEESNSWLFESLSACCYLDVNIRVSIRGHECLVVTFRYSWTIFKKIYHLWFIMKFDLINRNRF